MDDAYSVCPYCGTSVTDEPGTEAQQANPESFNEDASGSYTNFGQEGNTYTQPNYNQQQNYGQQNFGQQNYGGYYQQPAYHASADYTPAPRPQRSAYIAAILAFALGFVGIHNFYLDKKNRALIQLLVSLIGMVLTFGLSVIAMEVWAIIEGVRILKGEINTDGTGALIKMSF